MKNGGNGGKVVGPVSALAVMRAQVKSLDATHVKLFPESELARWREAVRVTYIQRGRRASTVKR